MLLDLLHHRPDPLRHGPARRPRLGAVAAVAAVATLVATLASCAATVPERLNLPFGDAQQLVVVTAPTWSSTSGSLTTYEKVDGHWRIVQAALPARLGRSGFSADHHEGDGTTPAGSFPVTGIMGRQPDPGVHYPYRQLVPGDCWVSDAASPSYNQLVTASPCVKPNEDMYAIGIGPYRYLATVGYNVDPVVPGLGARSSSIVTSTTRRAAPCPPAAASRSRRATCSPCCAGSTPACTRASSWVRTPG